MKQVRLISARPATRLEAFLIAMTFVTLPLFEAPKNVFSVLFMATWLIYAFRSRSLGRSAPFNLPILGLAAVLWIAPIFSDFGDVITPLNSAPRWTILALFVICVARLDYSRSQLQSFLAALLIGGVLAVIDSFWTWGFSGKEYPEFRSVGHVNHSSMYTIVVLAVGLGSLNASNKWIKLLGVCGILSTLVYLPASKSIVGAVSVLALCSFWGVLIWSYRSWLVRLSGTVIGITLSLTIILSAPVAQGFRSEISSRLALLQSDAVDASVLGAGDDSVFSGRERILNSALAVWAKHPLLGTGWFSFGVATSEEAVREELERNDEKYDTNIYWHMPHGHNLWTTVLVERGLIGVLLITVTLILYVRAFCFILFRRGEWDDLVVVGASSSLLVALSFAVTGLGNTTMMNEHGHAGMALIGVCYGYLRGRTVVERDP